MDFDLHFCQSTANHAECIFWAYLGTGEAKPRGLAIRFKQAAPRSPGGHSSPEDTGRERSFMKVLVSANEAVNVCCISWKLPVHS